MYSLSFAGLHAAVCVCLCLCVSVSLSVSVLCVCVCVCVCVRIFMDITLVLGRPGDCVRPHRGQPMCAGDWRVRVECKHGAHHEGPGSAR